MNEQEVLALLNGVGAVITDSHIVYASDKHGRTYVNKDSVYAHTRETGLLCRELAKRFANDWVDVVVAPAIGGVILSHLGAVHLIELTGRHVLAVFAEKSEQPGSWFWYFCFALRMLWKRSPQLGRPPKGRFVIRRGYEKLVLGKNVLVLEDILTTGGTAKKVVEAVRNAGGCVVGLGALCNRGGVQPGDVGDVPKLVALTNIKMDAWGAKDCPLCKDHVPINTEVGKGREFIAKNGKV